MDRSFPPGSRKRYRACRGLWRSPLNLQRNGANNGVAFRVAVCRIIPVPLRVCVVSQTDYRPSASAPLPKVLFRISAILPDKYVVDLFLDDAEQIFESALAASAVDSNCSEVAILLDSRRHIRMVDAAGWQVDSLRANYGATTVYRVARGKSGVCLEGRSGQRSCRLRRDNPTATARALLNAQLPQLAALSLPALSAPLRVNLAETATLAVIPDQGENWNRSERQRALFGFLHGYARPGT